MPAVVVLVTLVISVLGGWGAVVGVLRVARVPEPPAGRAASLDGHHVPVLDRAEVDSTAPLVLRGGTWIGMLERLATTGALLSGHAEMVVVVVAVKGLGRWADLQESPGAAERFIIGTLASLICACACGLAGQALMGG
ncbi:hypothetical protein D5R93_08770 [Actinomyces lilanjuaniae]|uniref:Uncharacterized protein n=1 Tax=Actinomyces lilanjuaniae TaxID=2321394 RepID=A0ABM6Z3Z0_9ACTO|nr:hypothetical protein [Actinomyces lilanjuaniae]AYD90078.1 hypothetical protein D5R93_08770 [Actinomyces lilanjuaniae]